MKKWGFNKKNYILLIFFFIFCISVPVFAQPRVEEIEKTQGEIEKEKLLKQRIQKVKPKPQIEEKLPAKAIAPKPGEKVFIKKINVIGVTLLSQKEIDAIILPFENKELDLNIFFNITDLITDRYRQKGYVTSRAYLPPQKIEANILEIRVIEGLTGNLEIKGNRYFKSSLIKEKIKLKKGQVFNYKILQQNLIKINEHPDRNIRAVLIPGKEPGTTDIILEVKDRLPVHLSLNWDNFGSRYIYRDRYQTILTFNNFIGREDILSLQYQIAQSDTYRLTALRYLYPLTESTQIGIFAARTKLDLGREYKDFNVRGKSRLYSVYLRQSLVDQEKINLDLNFGFDYKDIFNFQLGDEVSRDRLRVLKFGLDLDILDKLGRTILIHEVDFGLPSTFGALERKDTRASRLGSGGKFVKHVINLLRLQKMPFSSTLLWKNQIQLSPYILTAAEQFQIGGISNLRGYPPAEYVGDKGYASSWEWSFPFYFIPKTIKFPFSKAKFYDALRWVIFYDWANTHLKTPQPGEEKNQTLRSVGCGFRFSLPEEFFIRVDVAWPLDKIPSDNKHCHSWVQISKNF